MKKFLSLSLAVIMCIALFAISPSAGAASPSATLSFSPVDVVFNDDGSMIYMSDSATRKVYSINTQTFEQKSVTFDLAPESLCYYNGKLYVSLCTQAHNSYWGTEAQSGAFAIIDCATFTKITQKSINVDPYDIVVSSDDIIYIASGSGQWTNIFGFDQDGNNVATGQIRQRSTIEYNSLLNRIYSITSDSSPRNMSAFVLLPDGSFEDRGGNMGTSYTWPYHGNYTMGTTFCISPDGEYIFNSSGNVFTCLADKSNDMTFKTSLKWAWTDIAFNEDVTKLYTAIDNNKLIYAYNYGTFDGTTTYETQGYPRYISVKGDMLTSISRVELGGGEYFIETIDLTVSGSSPTMTITSRPLTYQDGRALLGAKSNAKTVFNGDTMYIADSVENAVFVIDSTNLTETKVAFQDTPNSLFYDAGELIVGFGRSGVVLILDASTFDLKDRLVLGTAFFDVASGKDGFIYIIENFGSSAFSYARSFSRSTGQQVSNIGVYPRNGKFVPHPINNMFYWADTGVSPQDINALVYENGVIKAAYDSPYHGQYAIGSRIRISPDGADIYTSSGNVFRSSSFQTSDMQHKKNFTAFTDLVFDLGKNQMFASQSRPNLIVYDYSTYANKGFIKTVFPVIEMSLNNGNIISLSSESNAFYLEILDSTNILQVLPERIDVAAGDAVFLRSGNMLNLNPFIVYNDGTSKPVSETTSYSYASSDPSVATVSPLGLVQALTQGHTVITIVAEGITKTVDVYVNHDVTSITVAGYNINFSPGRTNYYVMLPSGTSTAPAVTYDVPSGVTATVTQAGSVPGTARVDVTYSGGTIKSYYIHFYITTPPFSYSNKPFIIEGYYSISNGQVTLDAWIRDNPDYYGPIPGNFSLVIQLMSANAEPISIIVAENTRQFHYVFKDEYYAVIMVVDRFRQQGYIGIQLADPKRT